MMLGTYEGPSTMTIHVDLERVELTADDKLQEIREKARELTDLLRDYLPPCHEADNAVKVAEMAAGWARIAMRNHPE